MQFNIGCTSLTLGPVLTQSPLFFQTSILSCAFMNSVNAYFNPDVPWPSADEFMIRYNAKEQNGLELYAALGWDVPDEDSYSYFDSVPRLILKSINYEIDIEDALSDCYEEYLNSINYELTNEFGEDNFSFDEDMFLYFGSYQGLSEPIDRTVCVPLLHDESFYTEEFVSHLQQFLKDEYPLWRIYIVARSRAEEDESLTIYPDCIVAGSIQSTPETQGSLLKEWRQKNFDRAEISRGPRRRQFNAVKSKLPEALEQFKAQAGLHPTAFLQLAAFDNWRGDQQKASLWCLVASQKRYRLSLSSPESQLWCGTGDKYYFTSEDELTNQAIRYKDDEEVKFELTQFLFSKKPDCQRYDLGFREMQMIDNSLQITGIKCDFSLEAKDIISDESLKADELSGH